MKPLPCFAVEAALDSSLLAATFGGLTLADVSVGEGAVVGGTISAIIVVVGFVVTQYLRVRRETTETKTAATESEQQVADKQAARERKARKDAMDEAFRTIDDLRADRELDRKEIHDLRGEFQIEKTAHAVTKERLRVCEQERDEYKRRLDAADGDDKGQA